MITTRCFEDVVVKKGAGMRVRMHGNSCIPTGAWVEHCSE